MLFKPSSSQDHVVESPDALEMQAHESSPTHIQPQPTVFHIEHHSSSSELIRDAIIGLSDGLTVPFALTAGLSSLGSSRLVVLGGLAELFSGAMSMGLGAYLASVTEKKHYDVEEARERREVEEQPEAEIEEIYALLSKYQVTRPAARPLVEELKMDKENWVKVSIVACVPWKKHDDLVTHLRCCLQFMMDFELQLSKPSLSRAPIEGLVMGISYFLGGILPMVPYFAIPVVNHALYASIGITVVILLIFGYAKARITGTTHKDAFWSACQTLLVGAVAAAVSYGIVRGVDSDHHV